RVEIALALLVHEIGSVAAYRRWIALAQGAMQHVACWAALDVIVHSLSFATRESRRRPRSASIPNFAVLPPVLAANHRHCEHPRRADVALAIAGSFRHRQSDAHGHEHASACTIEALA